jgi:hypothetical protein
MTDSQGLGFTKIAGKGYSSNANTVYVFVSNSFASASSMTVTFGCPGDTATGANIAIARVSGMLRTGSSAVKQFDASHAPAGTPSTDFAASALNTNPTLGVVGNSSNPAGIAKPTSWTEQVDLGYSTPSTGLEYASRNSGFTGTTITWGSSATEWGAISVELDTRAPTPSNTPGGVIVPRPKIETYLGFAKPGGVAAILGKAFGTQGKVQARLKDWKGVAKDIPLKIIEDPKTKVPEWKPTLIGIEWPSDLTGFPDQDASIWVTRADGLGSNKHTVQFKPTLEFKMLPQSDVKVVSCSSDANVNGCNDADPGGDACFESLPFTSGQFDSSISGRHYNCWATVGDDSGTDTYQITLANGWTLEELAFHKFVEAGEGWVKSPASSFAAGASKWTAKIEWSVTPNDDLRYEGLVFIRGPQGVPHK